MIPPLVFSIKLATKKMDGYGAGLSQSWSWVEPILKPEATASCVFIAATSALLKLLLKPRKFGQMELYIMKSLPGNPLGKFLFSPTPTLFLGCQLPNAIQSTTQLHLNKSDPKDSIFTCRSCVRSCANSIASSCHYDVPRVFSSCFSKS